MDTTALRRKLREGMPVIGTWLTLGSNQGAEYLAHQGFDWLGIDLEEHPVHGNAVPGLVNAVNTTAAAPFVRSRRSDIASVKSAMALGAAGIFLPRVSSASQVSTLLAPFLDRSPTDGMLCIVMLETERGLDQVKEILTVPGVDACFIVPGEFTTPLSLRPRRDAALSEAADRVNRIRDICDSYGVVPGIHASTTEQACARIAEGWRLIAIGSDGALLAQSAAGTVRAVRESFGRRCYAGQHQLRAYEAGCAMLGAFELGGY